MDPFGMAPEQYTAAATWVAAFAATGTLGVLVVTARYARNQFEATQDLRRAQTRPYVVPSIDVEQQMFFMLRVENVGTTPAYNVRLTFDPPPRSTMGDMEDLRMLKEPIPSMPPGQAFRAGWETAPTVFGEDGSYPHPLSYRVTATYDDQQGHSYSPEEYVLDFCVYEGQAQAPKGMAELVKTAEKLLAEHEKWTQGTHGLRVNTIGAVRKAHRDNRPWHFRKTKQAYKEKGWKAAVLYWVGLWRRRYGLWSR